MASQQTQQQSNQQQPSVVPSLVMTEESQGAQIPAASALMAGQAQLAAPQLTAQQLTALAAASGGAVFIPNLMPGAAVRLPSMPATNPFIADMGMFAPGFQFPSVAASVQQQPQLPQTSDASGYRDFSRSIEETHIVSKDHSFPMKLHKILSNPENAEFITWLPHGRSWRVLKPKAVSLVLYRSGPVCGCSENPPHTCLFVFPFI